MSLKSRLKSLEERWARASKLGSTKHDEAWRAAVRQWQERLLAGRDPGPAPTPWGVDEPHWRHRLTVAALLRAQPKYAPKYASPEAVADAAEQMTRIISRVIAEDQKRHPAESESETEPDDPVVP